MSISPPKKKGKQPQQNIEYIFVPQTELVRICPPVKNELHVWAGFCCHLKGFLYVNVVYTNSPTIHLLSK